MYTVQLVVAFSAFVGVISAPADICSSITPGDIDSMATCCKYKNVITSQATSKCEQKAKTKAITNEYGCYQECLFSSDGLLGKDKKFNKAAWKAHVKKTIKGEWASIIAASADPCQSNWTHPPYSCNRPKTDTYFGDCNGGSVSEWDRCNCTMKFDMVQSIGDQTQCGKSGADILWTCMSMQWYLKCPRSSRVTSQQCEKSRKKLEKCLPDMFKKA